MGGETIHPLLQGLLNLTRWFMGAVDETQAGTRLVGRNAVALRGFFHSPKTPTSFSICSRKTVNLAARKVGFYRDAEREGPGTESWQQLSCRSLLVFAFIPPGSRRGCEFIQTPSKGKKQQKNHIWQVISESTGASLSPALIDGSIDSPRQ